MSKMSSSIWRRNGCPMPWKMAAFCACLGSSLGELEWLGTYSFTTHIYNILNIIYSKFHIYAFEKCILGGVDLPPYKKIFYPIGITGNIPGQHLAAVLGNEDVILEAHAYPLFLQV
jgi:hypothetical protein